MTASLNKVFILGHVGKDPEKFENLTTASVATTDVWKDKVTGEKKESTEWHRIVFLGKLAEYAGEYIKKGSLIHIEGSIHTKKYIDKAGIERYSTGIRAHVLKILDKKAHVTVDSAPNPYAEAPTVYQNCEDDGIPFLTA